MNSAKRLNWPLKEELTVEATEETKRRLRARIQARWAAEIPFHRRPLFAAWVAAAAVLFLIWGLSPFKPQVSSDDLLSVAGQSFHDLEAAPGGPDQVVSFTDGSSIRVASGGRVSGLGSNAQKMLVLLERGSAHFEITPGGPRQWIVEAGALSVEVLGTQFSVERKGERGKVIVTRGSVLVRSKDLDNGVQRLQAGQSLEVNPQPQNSVSLEPHPDTVAAGDPSDGTAALTLQELDETNAASSGRAPAESTRPSALDLIEGADLARLEGKTSGAIEALEKLIRLYPDDPRAASSRFQLVRLYLLEGHVQEAEKALAKLARGSGPLSEEAYLRWVEIKRSAGATAEARSLAKEYLRRYPEGRHRTQMGSVETP